MTPKNSEVDRPDNVTIVQREGRRLHGSEPAHPTWNRVNAPYTPNEDLMDRGIEFVEQPEERPYGIDSSFRDPCGNHPTHAGPRARGGLAAFGPSTNTQAEEKRPRAGADTLA
jgi:hypothetical protein